MKPRPRGHVAAHNQRYCEKGVPCRRNQSPPQALPASFPVWPSSKASVLALLSTEFVVAITVFAVLVPSSMAMGDLAGVTPVAGLYVAVAAMVMYALFGTSRQVIMGPEATAAIMTATAVAPLAGADAARYAALAAMLAILVGVVALLARVAKLGFITDLLSKPVLVGYLLGATLIVIASQLGKIFGISLESDKFFQQIIGTHQPPGRNAPAHPRHWRYQYGGVAHRAPRES